jgi:hypothetical protein
VFDFIRNLMGGKPSKDDLAREYAEARAWVDEFLKRRRVMRGRAAELDGEALHNRNRYQDLTDSEVPGIDRYVQLARNNKRAESLRVLILSLDFEHFVSVLSKEPEKVTPGSINHARELQDGLAELARVHVPLHLLGER